MGWGVLVEGGGQKIVHADAGDGKIGIRKFSRRIDMFEFIGEVNVEPGAGWISDEVSVADVILVCGGWGVGDKGLVWRYNEAEISPANALVS